MFVINVSPNIIKNQVNKNAMPVATGYLIAKNVKLQDTKFSAKLVLPDSY